MDYIFLARFEPDPEGGMLVTFPDVPEAITGGRNFVEAHANAIEALGLALRGILALDRTLPRPATREDGLVPVPVEAGTALKLAVIEAFRESGISKSELARRIDRAENEARRILDPDHPTKLATLESALAALGKEIVVSVRNAT